MRVVRPVDPRFTVASSLCPKLIRHQRWVRRRITVPSPGRAGIWT